MTTLRNEEIARQVEAGELSLEAIGKLYGISRERARQIAKAERVTSKGLQRQIRHVLPFSIEVVIYNPYGLPEFCSYGDCLEEVYAKDLCQRHYLLWIYQTRPERRAMMLRSTNAWRNRNPDRIKEIQKKAGERYRLRLAGLLPPVKRELVSRAGKEDR